MNALAAVAVVAVPLLLKTLIDQGILARNKGVVIAVAAVVAGLALVSALLTFAQRWYSARIGEGRSTTCAPRSSRTSSGSRSPSSPGPRPGPWSAG